MCLVCACACISCIDTSMTFALRVSSVTSTGEPQKKKVKMPCNGLIHWLGCNILSHRPGAKMSRTHMPARNRSLHLLLIAPFLKWGGAFFRHLAVFSSSVKDGLRWSLFGSVTREVADWSAGGVFHGHPCPRTPNLMISNGHQAHNSITHTAL